MKLIRIYVRPAHRSFSAEFPAKKMLFLKRRLAQHREVKWIRICVPLAHRPFPAAILLCVLQLERLTRGGGGRRGVYILILVWQVLEEIKWKNKEHEM